MYRKQSLCFPYAKSRFSHDAAHLVYLNHLMIIAGEQIKGTFCDKIKFCFFCHKNVSSGYSLGGALRT